MIIWNKMCEKEILIVVGWFMMLLKLFFFRERRGIKIIKLEVVIDFLNILFIVKFIYDYYILSIYSNWIVVLLNVLIVY